MKSNPAPLSRLVRSALLAFIACTFGSQWAHAQATRTWVSGVGDDANPCSRTAPGKTFAGAISKTAAGGEINVLDPGGFGGVTITKSITIDGGGGSIAGVLVSGTNAIIVNAASGDVVTLRNLDIDGLNSGLSGIHILGAGEVNIENCVIYGFNNGINIQTTAGPVRVNIKNTIVRKCSAGAVYARPGAFGATVNISKCSLNTSLFGFKAEDAVKAVLDDCVLAGNTNNGIVSAPPSLPTKVTASRCTINDSGAFGILSTNPNSIVHISNNTIFNNATGVGAQNSGLLISLGNNNIKGNTTDGTPTSTVGQQ